MDKIWRNARQNVCKRNKIAKTGYIGKNGFSLIEIVFTIIIIGLAMGAITESFIAGSAKSINIVNEETALNLAKREMAALNYCRNTGESSPKLIANCPFENGWPSPPPNPIYKYSPLVYQIKNECFKTVVTANDVNFNDNPNGTGTISPSGNNPTYFIQAIVQTGWFSANGSGNCPAVPANYPYVTLSTVYADY
jgi:prepilin-type N-terminal cleavage/methylation domain-containing protein